MKAIRWNDGWKFWADKDAFALVWSIPENAREVTLPHDAMIEKPAYAESPNGGNTGYRDGGNYTYVKMLHLNDADAGKKHILKFDGVYCHALVYVNEQLAGSEANGYSSFYVDCTPFLHAGDNEIRVQVKNAGMTNSRWYSGSGIYRDVSLLRADACYIEPDSVQVTTENAEDDFAVLSVQTSIINETLHARSLYLHTSIREGEKETGAERSAFFVKAGEKKTLRQRILVRNPRLWSEECPALYAVESRLCDGEKEIDSAEDRFGIRSLTLDAVRGLRVNGKSVKLRGACIHHDSGILGAATYRDAQFRQIRLLKEAGFNVPSASRTTRRPRCCWMPAMSSACM